MTNLLSVLTVLLAVGMDIQEALSFVPSSLPTTNIIRKESSTILPYKPNTSLPPSPLVNTSKSLIPKIIQGGMGVRISSWKLAREVSKRGGMGVISGTAMDTVFVRTLQEGDPGGHFQRALDTFPNVEMVERALDKYFIPKGKSDTKPYRSLPLWTMSPPRQLEEACILGNYCEVWLAKHDDVGKPTGGLVGINRLTKVNLPTIHSLYGAMLADVDYVIMGAGIPSMIPGILDSLVEQKACSLPIAVSGTLTDDEHTIQFSPNQFWKDTTSKDLAKKPLRRPKFLPIVSSTTLAQSLLKRSNGSGPTRGIDGFVVELNQAGGHNAPPRGWHYEPSEQGHEPVYGTKDNVDVEAFTKVAKGLPFWFAGNYGRKEHLVDVLENGGNGVQVGTLFALSNESGMDSTIKQGILTQLAEDSQLTVFTDPAASPTGFPFKVLQASKPSLNTLSNPEVYNSRPRVCNLGYLRVPYFDTETNKVGYRCPSESVDDYVAKGGYVSETAGRKCLCNALCADAGFPQVRFVTNPSTGEKELYTELGLVTLGDDVNQCKGLIRRQEDGTLGYSAGDVMDYLLSENQSVKPERWGYSETELELFLLSNIDESKPVEIQMQIKKGTNPRVNKGLQLIEKTKTKQVRNVNPERWGYSETDLDEYLLSNFDEFHTYTRENAALVMT